MKAVPAPLAFAPPAARNGNFINKPPLRRYWSGGLFVAGVDARRHFSPRGPSLLFKPAAPAAGVIYVT